ARFLAPLISHAGRPNLLPFEWGQQFDFGEKVGGKRAARELLQKSMGVVLLQRGLKPIDASRRQVQHRRAVLHQAQTNLAFRVLKATQFHPIPGTTRSTSSDFSNRVKALIQPGGISAISTIVPCEVRLD